MRNKSLHATSLSTPLYVELNLVDLIFLCTQLLAALKMVSIVTVSIYCIVF